MRHMMIVLATLLLVACGSNKKPYAVDVVKASCVASHTVVSKLDRPDPLDLSLFKERIKIAVIENDDGIRQGTITPDGISAFNEFMATMESKLREYHLTVLGYERIADDVAGHEICGEPSQ